MTRRTLLQSLNEIYREGGVRTSRLVLAPGPENQIVERVEMVLWRGPQGCTPARLCSSRFGSFLARYESVPRYHDA
jgi:hypothetical protein